MGKRRRSKRRVVKGHHVVVRVGEAVVHADDVIGLQLDREADLDELVDYFARVSGVQERIDSVAEIAARGTAHPRPVLALPAQCERPDPLDTATGTPEVPTLGRGAHITDPDTLRGHQHVPLAVQALADPSLPDDVREALAARLRPPAAEQWTRVPGDQRTALTGQTQGPGRGGEARTAVEAVYDSMTHTTRIGWTSQPLTADQAAAVRARAQEDTRA